jgi:hypothetical protein
MSKAPRLKLEFTGIAFRQNPQAPELFAFVAPADDLKKICGVARKSEHMLTNYQRALDDDRVDRELVPFFRIPQNSSPTAIVLSLHTTPVAKVTFEDISDPFESKVNLKKLNVELTDIDGLTQEEVVTHAKTLLEERLRSDQGSEKDEGIPDLLEVEEEADESNDGEETQEDSEETEDSNASEPVELGQSMLRQLKTILDDQETITPELIGTLRDMLRPALVIDGQHRLFGAAKVEERIPILVCSLVNPDWKEQVFQFTVINDKARGIPKPFITSLAGMSLTANELSQLQNRLTQAGVHLWEVEVMQKLGYDPASPFLNKIEFKISGTGSHGLGYQTMKQVGKAWFDPKSHGLNALMRVLYSGAGKTKKSRKPLIAEWQKENAWFEYFCCFWNNFKTKFGDTALWDLHSSLMTAVVLQQLQETFLTYLDSVAALTIETITEPDPDSRKDSVYAQFSKIVEQFSQKFETSHFPTERNGGLNR